MHRVPDGNNADIGGLRDWFEPHGYGLWVSETKWKTNICGNWKRHVSFRHARCWSERHIVRSRCLNWSAHATPGQSFWQKSYLLHNTAFRAAPARTLVIHDTLPPRYYPTLVFLRSVDFNPGFEQSLKHSTLKRRELLNKLKINRVFKFEVCRDIYLKLDVFLTQTPYYNKKKSHRLKYLSLNGLLQSNI